MVKIPEVYKEDDPGINLPAPMTTMSGLLNYVPPGPPVWNGAQKWCGLWWNEKACWTSKFEVEALFCFDYSGTGIVVCGF